MKKVLLISSSSRKGRLSNRVSTYLLKNSPLSESFNLRLLDLGEIDLPMFEHSLNEMLELPATIALLKESFDWADAMVMITPEYNGSYAANLKSAVDLMSKAQFEHKPIGICTVTTGALGGVRAAMQMQQLIPALFGILCPYMLVVPFVDQKFNEQGELVDQGFQRGIDLFCKEFSWLVNRVCS